MKQIIYNIELKNTTPFKVGNDEIEGTLKLRDVSKQYVLFGSSVAGALRKRLVNHKELLDLLGSENESKESRVKVSDLVCTKREVPIYVRDGIKIDYSKGVVENGAKYLTYFLEEEEAFEMSLSIDKASGNEELIFKKLIDEIQVLSKQKELSFGGDQTKGFGQVEILQIKRTETNLTNFASVEKVISIERNSKTQDFTHMVFTAKILDSLLIGGQNEITGDNEIKVDVSYSENGIYKIPSSTIKGSMRSFIAKISEDETVGMLFGSSTSKGIMKFFDAKLENTTKQIYHRIKINRMTNGVVERALLREARRISNREDESNLSITLMVERQTLNSEIFKNILLYFRDLSSGRIAIGSNESVGCGRLIGMNLEIDGEKYLCSEEGFPKETVCKLNELLRRYG